jgi:hypothetical protein
MGGMAPVGLSSRMAARIVQNGPILKSHPYIKNMAIKKEGLQNRASTGI